MRAKGHAWRRDCGSVRGLRTGLGKVLAGLGSLGGRCAGQQASRQQAERHVRQAVAMCGMVRQCLAEWCGSGAAETRWSGRLYGR